METKDYRQPRCQHGWVDIIQCEPCKTAAERDELKREFAPTWNEASEPTTLAAAAEDADEWLALIEKLHGRGVWQFSERESLQNLRDCRESLRSHLRSNVGGHRHATRAAKRHFYAACPCGPTS